MSAKVTPFFCADCDAELQPDNAIRKKDGRVICVDCERKLQAKVKDRAQGDLFVEQKSLFNSQRRNVEGYTDSTGFHPIRASKGYNEFVAGDFEPRKRLIAKQERQLREYHAQEEAEVKRDIALSGGPTKTLAQFVRAIGGITPGGMYAGEVKRLSYKQTGTTGLINQKARQGYHKQTPELAMDAANEEGYRNRNGERFTNIGDFLLAVEDSAVKGIDYYRARSDTAAQRRKKQLARAMASNPISKKYPRGAELASLQMMQTTAQHAQIAAEAAKQRYGYGSAKHRAAELAYKKASQRYQRAKAKAQKNPASRQTVQQYASVVRQLFPIKNSERSEIASFLLERVSAAEAKAVMRKLKLTWPRSIEITNPGIVSRFRGARADAGRQTQLANIRGRLQAVEQEITEYRTDPWFAQSNNRELRRIGLARLQARKRELLEQQKALTAKRNPRLVKDSKIVKAREPDGALFPVYNGELLSWSIGLYMTANEEKAGFPRAKRVIQAMRKYRPEQLERERVEMLKGSFDRMFGHNAKKVLRLIERERNPKAKGSRVVGSSADPVTLKQAREIVAEAKDYLNRTWPNTETENHAFRHLASAYEFAGFNADRAFAAATRELNKKHKRKGNPKAKGSRDAFGVWHPNPVGFGKPKDRAGWKVFQLQFTDAQGKGGSWQQVFASTVRKEARKVADEIKKAGGQAYIEHHKPKSQRNPSVNAIAEKFQGGADGSVEQSHAASSAPKNLARAGKLVFLKVGKQTFKIPGAMVAIAPNEKLWIVGDHAPLFQTKARAGEGLDVGEVTHICYETAKTHVGNGKTYEYIHEFGEDGGKRPHLIIDHEGMPILRGGDYKIKAEGIVN